MTSTKWLVLGTFLGGLCMLLNVWAPPWQPWGWTGLIVFGVFGALSGFAAEAEAARKKDVKELVKRMRKAGEL